MWQRRWRSFAGSVMPGARQRERSEWVQCAVSLHVQCSYEQPVQAEWQPQSVCHLLHSGVHYKQAVSQLIISAFVSCLQGSQ